MFILWLYSIITFALFLAEFAVLGYFASVTAARLYRKSRAEHILLVCALITVYMLFGMVVPAVFFKLTFPFILMSSIGIAYVFYGIAKRYPVRPIPETPVSPKLNDLLVGAILGLFLLMLQFTSLEHAGTDTYFYHLYYPGMWLTDKGLSRIPIPGFICEYYPCYAELLFGFLMAPFKSADVAVFLQPAAFLSTVFAIYAFGCEFGKRPGVSLSIALLMFFTCMLANNATMAYTDVLNGAILVDALVLFVTALRRGDTRMSVLAGAILGISSSIKLTGLFLTPFLALFFFVFFCCIRRESFRKCLPAIPTAILFAAPCYVINWIQTGNPFYPVRIGIGGIPIFSAGLEFERDAVGLTGDIPAFFFGNADWGMNTAGGILWGALPIAAIIACLVNRKIERTERRMFLYYAITLVVLFAAQLQIYPAIAEARQFIPWIMASSLLLFPVLSPISDRILVPLALAGAVLLYYTRMLLSPWRPYAVFAFFAAAVFFLPRRFHKKALFALAGILFIILPLLFAARISDLHSNGNRYAGRELSDAIQYIRGYYGDLGPVNIATVGTLFNYAFMEDMDRNRVISVPINRENSLAPHHFESFAAMRENPVSGEEWIQRLCDAEIDFVVVCKLNDEERLPNQDYERNVMESHPDRFMKCIEEENVCLYYLRRFL